ncbi:hypothetical protein [Rubripirellula reticaptiva]|nr:hypothetical protein [Rubripirellula reticaptiva]
MVAITTNPEVTEAELRGMMYLPTVIGLAGGVMLAMRFAGRPVSAKTADNHRMHRSGGG